MKNAFNLFSVVLITQVIGLDSILLPKSREEFDDM